MGVFFCLRYFYKNISLIFIKLLTFFGKKREIATIRLVGDYFISCSD